jgi:DNA-binding MarR family transcriptional regulator
LNSIIEKEKMAASKDTRELELLEALAEKPDARQVDLAARLGVAVGTVNWHLKRLAAKGYIKVKRIGRWHWGYLLTPQGVAEMAQLTMSYVHSSMNLYRKAREQSRNLLQQVKKAGFEEVAVQGKGDLVDVFLLTCLEQGIRHISNSVNKDLPIVKIVGRDMVLAWPDVNVKQRNGERGGI